LEREEIDIQMAELESRLDRLRALYEQYFLGIERIEPGVPRKDVERRVVELRRARFQSTAQRFKFQTIVQRYNTMQQHWKRICREIENGTYRRHKLRAERAFAQKEEEKSPREKEAEQTQIRARAADVRKAAEDDLRNLMNSELDMDTAMQDALRGLEQLPESLPPEPRRGGSLLAKLSEKAPTSGSTRGRGLMASAPPRLTLDEASPAVGAAKRSPGGEKTPAGAPPRAPADAKQRQVAAAAQAKNARAAAAKLSDDRVRALHQAYVDARQRTNAKSVSFEKLERSLRETEAKLRASHKGKNVDFDVLVKNGKAILKPRLS
jgi:hypothetical protein